MPKFRMVVSTGYHNAKHEEFYEIDDAEWEQMSEKSREDELNGYLQDMIPNYIDAWYEEV